MQDFYYRTRNRVLEDKTSPGHEVESWSGNHNIEIESKKTEELEILFQVWIFDSTT